MALLNHWLLTIVLLVPAAGAGAVWFVRPPKAMRWVALGVSLATFCLSLLILLPFKSRQGGEYAYGAAGTVQMLCQSQWWGTGSACYKVAIDGLSFPFVVLTTVICSAACAASFNVGKRPRLYFSLLLLLETMVLGAFLSFDLVLLYGFLLLSLLPACLLIALWGGTKRMRALARLLAYMLVGLACLAVAVWGNHVVSRRVINGGTFDLVNLASRGIPATGRILLVLAVIGFLIRLPVFPFHAWLADVLSESPGPVAAVLGALIPLTGGYGILRIVLPLFSHEAVSFAPYLAPFGALSIFYGALRAMGERNPSRSVAYASISLMGLVLLGITAMTPAAVNGAVFILLSQGLIVALVMLTGGRLSEQSGTQGASPTQIPVRAGSVYTTFFAIGWLAELIIPGFIGPLMVVLGLYQAARPDSLLRITGMASPREMYALASCAGIGIVLMAGYGAAALRRTFATGTAAPQLSADLSGSDISFLTPLAVITILLGMLPTPLCFGFTRHAVESILQLSH